MKRELAVGMAVVAVAAVVVSGTFFSTSQPAPTTRSPLDFGMTVEEELLHRGDVGWLTRIIIPSLNSSWMLDINSFRDHNFESVTALDGNTVRILASKGQIELISRPTEGYRRVTIGPNFVPEYSRPGLRPGDVLEHISEVPTLKILDESFPTFGVYNASRFMSYGRVVLHRGGVDYHGVGEFIKTTASRLRDPGASIPDVFMQNGWVSNNEFVLQHLVLRGLQTSVEEAFLTWRSGGTETVRLSMETVDCTSFTYLLTTSRGLLVVEVFDVKYVVGGPCKFGEMIALANANVGGAGLAAALVVRT